MPNQEKSRETLTQLNFLNEIGDQFPKEKNNTDENTPKPKIKCGVQLSYIDGEDHDFLIQFK